MASSSCPMKHQVFLSFRGEETRLNFTSHLLKALKDTGIDVFFDEEKLEKGEQFTQALSQAIAASNLSIIILSSDYASSKSCLAEISEIMDRKDTRGHIVLPIFYHVDPSHVRHLGGSFKASFEEHESNSSLDEVKRWKDTFAEAGKLKGWHIEGGKFDRSEAEYIKDIVKYVIHKLRNSKLKSASKELVGIDNQKNMILKLIEQKDCRVIGLWGMGGIGKTTLAESVFKEVSLEFEDRYFLQNVSQKIEKQGIESLRNELLSKLLNDKEICVDTPSIGYPYEERLNNKRVIVVLDDVTDSDQIDFLGVRHFGDGSKIIITSRDRQVLKNGGADKIHEVKKLNEDDSLQLFSTFAFKQMNPSSDFLNLSYKFVEYADGSPLALKVLGSKLFSKSQKEWESEVDKLKRYAEPKISQILKSSFDGLDELEKNIFLDIACLFKGEAMDDVENTLNSFYKGAVSGISNLLDKCLLDTTSFNIIEGNLISMHDMFEEMAKDIVRQESKDPGQRSRLWNPKDVCQVLKNNKGTDLIEGIKLDMSQIDKLQLCPAVFENMLNLRHIHFYVPFHFWRGWNQKLLANGDDIVSLPNELRYLRWEFYPFKSLSPSFNPKNLVVLKLDHGKMIQLWNEDGYQVLVNLRVIDVSFSKNLKKIPNLLGAINLESLCCYGCESLVELLCLDHLTSLETLQFSGCKKLRKIPNLVGAINLETLDCTGCQRLVELPSLGHLTSLEKLNHKSLKYLSMVNCERLKSLSELPPDLKFLKAHGCTSLEDVSFTYQNLHSFDGEGDYFCMIFSNCFSLSQDSIDNIEANAMLNIQSLAEKWTSRYDQEFSPDSVPKLFCCLPGNKISANRFGYQSLSSSLNLKIVPSGNRVSRFLVFAICLVADITHCYCVRNLEIICEYQLVDASGTRDKFKCELFSGPFQRTDQKCLGDHLLILCGKDMIREDKNYEEASFKFSIKYPYFNEDKDENVKVEKCGVHVFYVDVESYTINDVMRCDKSNQNFYSQEDAIIEEPHHHSAMETSFSYIGGEEGDKGSKRLKYSHF